MKTAQDEYFHVSDLALIATLLFWFTIESIEWEGQRAIFIFRNSPELKEKVERFWNGQLKVNPLDYFNKLKIIKTRLHQ